MNLTKENYISKMSTLALKSGDTTYVSEMTDYLGEHWDEIAEAYNDVYRHLPDIGFLSRTKRLNAFYVACEILERRWDNDELESEGVMTALTALKLFYNPFDKAITMFDTLLTQGRINKMSVPTEGGRVIFTYAKTINPYF